ncbi:MAG: hypothetical protein KIT10_01085 [Flavobacteriales bacterium]|nr:hypothetical protein [Flavobacteriales bacterium]
MCSLLLTLTTWSQPGAPDPAFNGSGVFLHATSPAFDELQDIRVQPDGRIVGGGYTTTGVFNDVLIVRLLPNGAFDPSFGGTGTVVVDVNPSRDQIYALALQADGRIVAAGSTFFMGSFDEILMRLNTDGTLDNSFGSNGVVVSSFAPGASEYAYGVAVLTDQRILTAGTAGDLGRVTRYLSNGALDPSFGTNGSAYVGSLLTRLYALHVLGNGSILVAGHRFVNDSALYVGKLTSNGAVDMAFGTNGEVVIPINAHFKTVTGLAVDGSGRILCSGYCGTSATTCEALVLRLLANGQPDPAWGGDGLVFTSMPPMYFRGFGDVRALPDGKVIAGGYQFFMANSVDADVILARFDAQGNPDPLYGVGGIAQLDLANEDYDRVWGMELDAQGRALLAGSGRLGTSQADIAIARFLNDGTVDVSEWMFAAPRPAWPVPAADHVWLHTDFASTGFRVMDAAGRLVGSYGASRSIDVRAFPNGVYMAVSELGHVARFVVEQ